MHSHDIHLIGMSCNINPVVFLLQIFIAFSPSPIKSHSFSLPFFLLKVFTDLSSSKTSEFLRYQRVKNQVQMSL